MKLLCGFFSPPIHLKGQKHFCDLSYLFWRLVVLFLNTSTILGALERSKIEGHFAYQIPVRNKSVSNLLLA